MLQSNQYLIVCDIKFYFSFLSPVVQLKIIYFFYKVNSRCTGKIIKIHYISVSIYPGK